MAPVPVLIPAWRPLTTDRLSPPAVLAFPVEQGQARESVAGAGMGGEAGFAPAKGDEQLVGLAGLVPEHALMVDPGGAAEQHAIAAGFCEAVGGFDFGVAAVTPARSPLMATGLPGC